jgi:plasmid stability protein
MTNDNKTIIIRNVPEHLKRSLKVQAAKEGRSMAAIILDCVRAYLEARRT